MKKITFLLACLGLFGTKSYAQFPESFEGTTFPPAGWASFIGTNQAGAGQNWQRTTADFNTGTASAFVRWDNTAPGAPKEDWLVTPQFTVTAETPNLAFFHRQQYTFDYTNGYAIKVSTTSQTDHASFTDILVIPESAVPMTFGPQMVDLSNYIGQQVYVAFVMTNDDGDNWLIDDVSLSADVEAPLCASGPTPANGAVNVPTGEYTFSWVAPEGDVLSYNLYAGDSPTTATMLVGNFTETSVTLNITGFNATIYWQVVPVNAAGPATGCDVWSFTTESAPGFCLDVPNGQWPTGTEGFTPEVCDGVTINEIVANAYTGEYSIVNVTEGQTYTFISGTTDFVTIGNSDGAISYGAGESPFTWVSTTTGQVWFISHNNDQCEYESVNRVRAVICGVPSDETPDYANLQYPSNETIVEGGSITVYGQVYEAGLTDVEPGLTGQAEGIQMWVGVSAENTDPATWSSDQWVEGEWNALAQVTNNDEYMAVIGQDLEPGMYYFATRWRLNDGGYVYGGTDGTNGNFWDGTTYNSGVLTVTPAPAPNNDECTGAFPLTPGGDFASGALTTTNVGATAPDSPLPSCQEFAVENVWYSVVVPDSGSLTFETGTVEGSDFQDTVMVIYSGTCGSLTEIGCSDDEGTDLFSLITVSGRDPGETLYVSVWRYDNDNADTGAFQISAYDASLTAPVFAGGSFSYYPNPVKNVLNVSAANEISSASVYNMLGQRVLTAQLGTTIGSVDMSALPKGAYLVKLSSGKAEKTIKVIKE